MIKPSYQYNNNLGFQAKVQDENDWLVQHLNRNSFEKSKEKTSFGHQIIFQCTTGRE